jgi:hypothetical protein
MDIKKFKLLKKEVEDILAKSPIDFDVVHSRLVLRHVLKLKPRASEALKIAAITHDIDRGVTGITETYDLKDPSKSALVEFKRQHAIRSAEAAVSLLKRYGYKKFVINEVKNLVKRHEVGGTPELNILMEADSLAYFDYNIPFYLRKNGPEKARTKINFMYQRLSKQGQKIVQRMKFKNKKIRDIVHQVISK